MELAIKPKSMLLENRLIGRWSERSIDDESLVSIPNLHQRSILRHQIGNRGVEINQLSVPVASLGNRIDGTSPSQLGWEAESANLGRFPSFAVLFKIELHETWLLG